MRIPYTIAALFLACFAIGIAAPPATNPQPLARQADDAPKTPDLVGYYTVQGQIVGSDNPYAGIVSITKDGKAYRVRWLLEDGSMAVGVGILDGSSLCVGSSVGAGRAVSAKYEVTQAAGKVTLAGRWASVPGNGQVHTETLTWLRGPVKVQGDI